MFGAADPEQAISQLEAYYREGRGERAEVMASALVDQLIALKDRDDDTQGILVRGLRILAGVLNSRGKYKRARTTIGLLHKHRNKHGKAVGHDFNAAAADYHLAGFIHSNAGKKGAAKKAFAKCEKLQPGHLAAALDLAEQCGFSKTPVLHRQPLHRLSTGFPSQYLEVKVQAYQDFDTRWSYRSQGSQSLQ